MPTAVCWQFENVTAYLSSWVGREGKSPTIYPKDWSEVPCAVYPIETH